MNILAHRGAWKEEKEKNSVEAIRRAFGNGWGVETDLRDFMGRLVISHDISTGRSADFDDVLREYKESGMSGFLAVNIKADGLQSLFSDAVKRYNIEKYAVFDMSVPEQVMYEQWNIPFFSRQSEIEKTPVMYEKACGIWMDEWRESWIDQKEIERHLDHGKIVGIISPEIHGRDNSKLWNILKQTDSGNVYLCTDEPWTAEEVFNGKQKNKMYSV